MMTTTDASSPWAIFRPRSAAQPAGDERCSNAIIGARGFCAPQAMRSRRPWRIHKSTRVGGRSSQMTPSADK